MGIRIWIDPIVFPPQHNPQGSPFILIDGVEQRVDQEGGLLFYHTGMMSPVNPKLKKGIVKVTYNHTVEDRQQAATIVRGRYVHGKFEASVLESTLGGGDHGPIRRVLKVTASAPTISLIRRWVSALLSGTDVPKEEYGRYPTPPTFASPAEA